MDREPDLLRHQVSCPRIVLPPSQKQLPEERIQRLLFAPQLLVPTAVLLFERAEEPLQHQQSALLRIRL